MAEYSSIEWTDATWNPITGCSLASPGCTNCYAMKLAGTRLRDHPSRAGLTVDTRAGPVWSGHVRLNPDWLDQPLRWRRPRRIFVCAHGDLFHESVPIDWIDQVFAVMALSPQHTFQVLTKRARRMREYLEDPNRIQRMLDVEVDHPTGRAKLSRLVDFVVFAKPLPNVWMGISAENQGCLDERWPDLAATPAAVRFLSLEPLLGPIELDAALWPFKSCEGCPCPDPAASREGFEECCRDPQLLTLLHLVIVGGENGDRPIHPAWVRQIRDDCAKAEVPFFFKQWGTWAPVCTMADTEAYYHAAPKRDPEGRRRCKVDHLVLHADGSQHRGNGPEVYAAGKDAMMCMAIGKAAAGRLLDGREHNAMPALAVP